MGILVNFFAFFDKTFARISSNFVVKKAIKITLINLFRQYFGTGWMMGGKDAFPS